MKNLLKIVVAVAVLLAIWIAYLELDARRREQALARELAELGAEYQQLLTDESRHPAPDVKPMEPRPADLDWKLHRVGGGPELLSEHRGKTIFIDVWATWCKPCIAQMPSIQRLHDLQPSDEFAFLLISPEDEDVVSKFLAAHDFTLPFYLTGEDHPESFALRPLPFTYVINPQAEIVYQEHGGPNRYDDPAFVEFLRSWSST